MRLPAFQAVSWRVGRNFGPYHLVRGDAPTTICGTTIAKARCYARDAKIGCKRCLAWVEREATRFQSGKGAA